MAARETTRGHPTPRKNAERTDKRHPTPLKSAVLNANSPVFTTRPRSFTLQTTGIGKEKA